MTIQTITTKLIEEPPTRPEGKRYLRIHDDRTRGFHAELRRSCISFKFRYFDRRHRERTITIGRYGDISVAQARRRAEELRAEITMGGDPAADRRRALAVPTVANFTEERLMPDVRQRLSGAVTYAAFARRLVTAIGRHPLDEVTPEHIAAYRASLIREGLASATVNRHLAFARMLFNKALKWGVMTGRNPAESPGMLFEEGRDLYLTTDSERALVVALGRESDRTAAAAIGLLMLTGARRGEVLRARWRYIDFDRQLLFVPRAKSGRPHRVPLSATAVELLRLHRARLGEVNLNDPVFPGRRPGKPMADLRGAWKRVKEDAGLPADLRLHDLRHSFASSLVNRGVPLNEVAVLLGHRQLSTTARYAHHASERLIQSASLAAEAWVTSPAATATADHGDS